VADGKRVGVIAIDPTSPFNYGSLLGDRVRMGEHATNEQVYIRSLATRGALGGLSAKSIEIVDVMKASNFDVIVVETVGVGQSEIEIVGLADITVLVLVPESGDEIQVLKSGIMEIADIFVVNKSDRPGAAGFAKNITQLLHQKKEGHQVVITTIATEGKGVEQLKNKLLDLGAWTQNKKQFLMAEKAFQLIQRKRMKDINKQVLFEKVGTAMKDKQFNLYRFVEKLV
jgi:LAO/AO transport system kinase